MLHRPGLRSGGRNQSVDALAKGLGWFSIGLGLAQTLAPRTFARGLGMERHTGLIRAYGLREIATGVGILTREEPANWVWGRVGGDALDLATLATAATGDNPRQRNVWLAMAAVAGVTALDLLCARELSERQGRRRLPPPDYGDRRGMPDPPDAMRGRARETFRMPKDMRVPEAMRAYTSA